MKAPLNVFFEKTLVGTLVKRDDDTLSFSYVMTWLQDARRFALSPALPLQEEAFGNRQTKSYFDNLLPEGEALRTIEKILKRTFEDPYALLANYGLDCAGALEITPNAEAPPPQGTGKLEKLPFQEIDALVERGESLYVHNLTSRKGRFSLAGAQDKIPVLFRDGDLYIPLDATPSTHILKPPARLRTIFDSVHNEFYCMSLATLCGLHVPEVQVIGEATPLFLIRRFDRKTKEQAVKRIHQFDFCQALGYPASEKYEEDGGPTFAQDYRCIADVSDTQIQDRETILNWLAFNLLIGNNDSHSKNLSFILDEGETRVAPLYDLMSTSIYRNLAAEFSFKIGGQSMWHQLRRKHFELLAKDLGFKKREEIVAEKILQMANKLEEATHTFVSMNKDQPEPPVIKTIRHEVEKRIRTFREKLGSKPG